MPARSKARATPQQEQSAPDVEAKTTPQSVEAMVMAAAGGGNQAVLAMMGGGGGVTVKRAVSIPVRTRKARATPAARSAANEASS